MMEQRNMYFPGDGEKFDQQLKEEENGIRKLFNVGIQPLKKMDGKWYIDEGHGPLKELAVWDRERKEQDELLGGKDADSYRKGEY